MQKLPQSCMRAQLWRTHRARSCVMLLTLAGISPLSWLPMRALQMRAPPQPPHARQLTQARTDLSAPLHRHTEGTNKRSSPPEPPRAPLTRTLDEHALLCRRQSAAAQASQQ
jgi:hypothetical protein